jgi:Helix-turn-helix of DDE superfamily endonuclease
MLFYRAALPLSRKTLNYAAGIIRRHRQSIGSLWRKLNPGQQALLVLLLGETFAELAAGFGVGLATAWRYVNETVELLAARAPKLRKAVRDAKKAGTPTWCWTARSSRSTGSPRTARSTPASTSATG